MIRKAVQEDLPGVAAVYSDVLDKAESGAFHLGWTRGVYPTEQTAAEALANDALFVMEDAGGIIGTARIDQQQGQEERDCPWPEPVPDEEVMVLHTLAVTPRHAHEGCGKQFLEFYEQYARSRGCTALRLSTGTTNQPVQALYESFGFQPIHTMHCCFNETHYVDLVFMEKRI